MRPDRFRVWIRDWLNAPTREEVAAGHAQYLKNRRWWDSLNAEGDECLRLLTLQAEIDARTRELLRDSFPGFPATSPEGPAPGPDPSAEEGQ